MMMSPKDEVKKFARSQGADLIGVAPVEVYSDYLAEVQARRQETGAGGEDFMIPPDDIAFFERLARPRDILPDAQTIIVLGVGAYDKTAAYADLRKQLRGKTARSYYYYPVARQIAEALSDFIMEKGYKAFPGQNVPLKFLADRVGMGAYGKNGLLLTEQCGSYIALRSIITNMPLVPDRFKKIVSPCEGCEACVKTCPTGALYAPYKVNPKLCVNPITRKQAHISPDLRRKMGRWICGCDICQEVCPVNRKLEVRDIDPRAGFDPAHHASHQDLGGIERTPLLTELLDEKYPDVVRRNACIGLANIGKDRAEALEALETHLATTAGELKQYFLWAISCVRDGVG